MKTNLKLFIRTIWYSFFKSDGTPGRITPKRFLILLFIFFVYPLWHYSIRLAYGLDQLFYPEHSNQSITQPVFIVGNFRSGTTLLHRLLAKDRRFTGMQTWEIYVAPSIIQRKLIRFVMKINRRIGNPIGKIIKIFEIALREYSYMHPTGLNKIEEDGHVLMHIWSSYNLFAFFPFPELIRNYIYYDNDITDDQKNIDMAYYQEVLKRHIYANDGKQYISKSPSFSPKVRTLHQKFPDAKFINLVRSPLRVIPSSVSMFSNHWKTYGEPAEDYPKIGADFIQEQAKHWYIYPHQYLKKLPSNQYLMVRYNDLVANPKQAIELIYQRFGLTMTEEFQQILIVETEKARKYKSGHSYSMKKMGLDRERIKKEFGAALQQYSRKPKTKKDSHKIKSLPKMKSHWF